MSNHIIEKARIFATAAHGAVNQLRKYTNEPYIVHPAEVVSILKKSIYYKKSLHSIKVKILAAAWLHDVVEDTKCSILLIEREFGHDIASLVDWMTDRSKPEDGNREIRKKIDANRLANSPAEVQTIKVADLISNSKTILERDHDFAIVYLKEKEQLLNILTKADIGLLNIARDIVDKYKKDK
jgi:(p)ppGpp synthase/HD superfamily hydrolase